MKYGIKPSKNCVKCGCELSKEYIRSISKTEFNQTWCLLCILKYGESYPTTRHKIEAIQEVNKMQRKAN